MTHFQFVYAQFRIITFFSYSGQRTEFREGDIHGLNRLYSFARAGTNLSMSNPPIVNDSGKIKNVIYHVTYVLLVVTCALLFIL